MMAVTGKTLEAVLASVGLNLVTRAEWGARAPRAINLIQLPTAKLVIHHTADDRQGESIRAHQNYHMNTKGWNDLAYSLMVDNRGVVYEGRGIGVQGGHTAGYNRTSHAICLFGNFQNHAASAAALQTVVKLAKLGRDKKWWVPTLHGHRDLATNGTLCPGHYLYAQLPNLRRLTAAAPVAPKPPARPPLPTGRPAGAAPVLRQGSRGVWVVYLQKLLRRDNQNIAVDGDFGPKTRAAVINVQRFFRLVPDGIVGPKTWGVLHL